MLNDADIQPSMSDVKLGAGEIQIEQPTVSSGPLPKFNVSIVDHEKKGEGVYQYTSYIINTTWSDGGKEDTVARRFSDFVWLHELLQKKYLGSLIPPIPDKGIIGRFNLAFIQGRKRGLERFLNSVAAHRELQTSPDVELFLSADDVTFQGARDAKESTSTDASGSSTSFFGMLKDGFQQVRDSFNNSKERPKDEDDKACDKITGYSTNLEQYLTAASTNTKYLIQRNKAVAKCWFELGLACTMLGKYETQQDEQALGNFFTKFGTASDRLAMLENKKADMENLILREPLKDYIRIVGAVKVMMDKRNELLSEHHTNLNTLEMRQANLAEVQGVPGKETAALEIEQQVVKAQHNVDRSQAELKRVTAAVIQETKRFRGDKARELKAVINKFVKHQIEYAKRVQRAWEDILPDLETAHYDNP